MRWSDWLPIGCVASIEPEALARRLADRTPPQILDVRTSFEFKAGHIAGSRHVPVHELASRLHGLHLDPRRQVVAICKTAHRSIPAVRLLSSRGFEACQLAGGMDRWRRSGLPVVRGDAG